MPVMAAGPVPVAEAAVCGPSVTDRLAGYNDWVRFTEFSGIAGQGRLDKCSDGPMTWVGGIGSSAQASFKEFCSV
jgi:hypothetical protein